MRRAVRRTHADVGYTFGATWWTDGKCEAPMLLDQLLLVGCPHCRALCWLADVPVLREEGPSDRSVVSYRAPTMREYLSALARGLDNGDEVKGRYLRIQAWWAANDRRRRGTRRSSIALSRAARANLESLITLLDESVESDRVMKAEAARELGNFDEAMRLQSFPFSTDYQEAVECIRRLVQQRVTAVAALDRLEPQNQNPV